MTRISDIVDNRAAEGFCAEHGLSLLIEVGGERVLFDTGAGAALLPNAEKMGIDLESVTRIVLSHSHYDHTGGFGKLKPKCPVHVMEGVRAESFSRQPNEPVHPLGMPEESLAVLEGADERKTEGAEEIARGVWLSGPIGRENGAEHTGGFYFDRECTRACNVPEEQALLTEDGVLVTGCCHAGIVNTVESFRRRAGLPRIRAIAGGLHFHRSDEREVVGIVDYLNGLNLDEVVMMHCTGEDAGAILSGCLNCRVRRGEAGKVYEFKGR